MFMRHVLAGYYLLGKGGYVFGGVGLFVCLQATLLKKL